MEVVGRRGGWVLSNLPAWKKKDIDKKVIKCSGIFHEV